MSQIKEILHDEIEDGQRKVFYKEISDFIFSDNEYAIIFNQNIKKGYTSNLQLRYCDIGAIRYQEQNPYKHTEYANRALQGERIIWGMKTGKWLSIINGELKK